jgi:hypothetical protein
VFPLLVLSLVLGHASEVLAAAPVAMSSHHADDHHHAPGPATESVSACDAIDGLPRTAAAAFAPDATGAVVGPPTTLGPVGRASALLDGSSTLRARLPLFLLYASLLR